MVLICRYLGNICSRLFFVILGNAKRKKVSTGLLAAFFTLIFYLTIFDEGSTVFSVVSSRVIISLPSRDQLSKAYSPFCTICDKDIPGKYHLVTNFFPVSHPKWSQSVGIMLKKEEENSKQLKLNQRVMEVLGVLQDNLNNDLIIAVHILYDHPYTMLYLMQAPLPKRHKIVYHQVPTDPTYRHSVDYVQNYLFNKSVIITNQDIRIGKGFEKVNTTKLSSIAYALSRHGKKEKYCEMPGSCGLKEAYIGSHDTFVFRQTRRYSNDELVLLDSKFDNYGIENVVIHFLINVGNYTVLNPCYVLYTYHVHCLGFRNKRRIRVNLNGKSGTAPFTDKLE